MSITFGLMWEVVAVVIRGVSALYYSCHKAQNPKEFDRVALSQVLGADQGQR